MMRGRFQVDDLTTLFLALRDRAGGRQSVVEVGAFVAHREERTKGYVTKAVREFFVRIRYLIETRERPATIYDMPPYVAEYLQASAKHMDYKAAKGNARFTRVNVAKALPRLLSCIRASNGRCFLWPSVTQEDIELFNFLAGTLTFSPLFTEDSLFRDFCDALIENALLEKAERAELDPLKGAIALFAVTYMHQSFVDLGDGIKGYLDAMPYGGGSDTIAVTANVPAIGRKKVTMAHAVFLTERTVENDCAPDLPFADRHPTWDFPLEVGSDKKLRKLGS
jgi:hypothetical protein